MTQRSSCRQISWERYPGRYREPSSPRGHHPSPVASLETKGSAPAPALGANASPPSPPGRQLATDRRLPMSRFAREPSSASWAERARRRQIRGPYKPLRIPPAGKHPPRRSARCQGGVCKEFEIYRHDASHAPYVLDFDELSRPTIQHACDSGTAATRRSAVGIERKSLGRTTGILPRTGPLPKC